MHSASMTAGDSGFSTRRSRTRAYPWPARSVESRKHRCEQVAAVCYRTRSTGIEFLLVRTRNGRWTFPKGGVESELTLAQTAALEAFEEAGVHGRIEEASFARYCRYKRNNIKAPANSKVLVHAYLCEVLRLGPPQEPNRNRTWFFPDKAKACLREDRSPENGAELARVVDRAVARIQRLHNGNTGEADALRRVQFEASEGIGVNRSTNEASLFTYIRRGRSGARDSAALKFAVSAYLREALRLKPAQNNCTDGGPRTVEGTRAALVPNNHVIEIDRRWKTITETKASSRAGKKSQRLPK